MKVSLKHIILIFCCALIANHTTAQFNPVIAYTPKTQVIYIGTDNPISVSLGNYKLSEINIKVSEGIIKNTAEEGKYLWRICNSKSDSVFLSIYCNKVLVKRFKYNLLPILNPAVSWGRFSEGCPPAINNLKTANGLLIYNGYETFYELKVPEQIRSFCIEFFDSSYNTFRILYNDGPYFTKAVKKEIDLLKAKQGVSVYNITVQIGCEEKPRMLANRLMLIISD